jgi:selenocysteine lyase/cysteine desulfurase
MVGRPLNFAASARRFEAGTQALAIMAGMKASLDLMLSVGVEVIEDRVLTLAGQLVEGLLAKGYRVAGSTRAGEGSAIVSFTRRPGLDLAETRRRLNERGVDHIVTHDRLKLSPHFYNIAAEVDAVLACL